MQNARGAKHTNNAHLQTSRREHQLLDALQKPFTRITRQRKLLHTISSWVDDTDRFVQPVIYRVWHAAFFNIHLNGWRVSLTLHGIILLGKTIFWRVSTRTIPHGLKNAYQTCPVIPGSMDAIATIKGVRLIFHIAKCHAMLWELMNTCVLALIGS